ncbi:hypothetical protein AGLY_013244 [Aphis glycines]|uniref:Uncharacterized protein n=1 Tax=Aphis glycines TaxID=307491 RepID=A0A6G0T6D9_APHGL|nr:hypothetical protein AGLY_013244 [Aphis glycines]
MPKFELTFRRKQNRDCSKVIVKLQKNNKYLFITFFDDKHYVTQHIKLSMCVKKEAVKIYNFEFYAEFQAEKETYFSRVILNPLYSTVLVPKLDKQLYLSYSYWRITLLSFLAKPLGRFYQTFNLIFTQCIALYIILIDAISFFHIKGLLLKNPIRILSLKIGKENVDTRSQPNHIQKKKRIEGIEHENTCFCQSLIWTARQHVVTFHSISKLQIIFLLLL